MVLSNSVHYIMVFKVPHHCTSCSMILPPCPLPPPRVFVRPAFGSKPLWGQPSDQHANTDGHWLSVIWVCHRESRWQGSSNWQASLWGHLSTLAAAQVTTANLVVDLSSKIYVPTTLPFPFMATLPVMPPLLLPTKLHMGQNNIDCIDDNRMLVCSKIWNGTMYLMLFCLKKKAQELTTC